MFAQPIMFVITGESTAEKRPLPVLNAANGQQ